MTSHHRNSLCECPILGSCPGVCYNKCKKRKGCSFGMAIDPMTKMNISMVAIALMFLCNFLMIFTRKLTNRLAVFLMKTTAFLMLIAVFFMIVIVIFA
ncbi:DUF2768 domain-containing protein [Brevibacillus humidisoli]|uniref:DUF2768 domain-containing protein n=1 Tax=Brevibacillus humidisoli TaxID=2895522 RepID=UPI0030BA0445